MFSDQLLDSQNWPTFRRILDDHFIFEQAEKEKRRTLRKHSKAISGEAFFQLLHNLGFEQGKSTSSNSMRSVVKRKAQKYSHSERHKLCQTNNRERNKDSRLPPDGLGFSMDSACGHRLWDWVFYMARASSRLTVHETVWEHPHSDLIQVDVSHASASVHVSPPRLDSSWNVLPPGLQRSGDSSQDLGHRVSTVGVF